jgi:D-sedoheptulose 7-phosphate isomerase
MSYTQQYLQEVKTIVEQIDADIIEKMVNMLAALRERGGRLFFLGIGGSAANASHAVNDFRKLTGIEAYAPTDNVSELSARANDEGWETIFSAWLKTSRLSQKDMLFVLSVGGGDLERNISPNLVRAIELARQVGAQVIGIVGRGAGYTAQAADACLVIPTVNPENITPHSEAFQAVIWHLLVSHPVLKATPTKWESIK